MIGKGGGFIFHHLVIAAEIRIELATGMIVASENSG